MKRVPANIADYYDTFADYIDGIMKKYGDKPAVTYFDREKNAVTHSYRQLGEEVLSLATALYARDFFGKNLAIIGENSYDWLVAYLASAAAGAVAVCIDIEQSDETICQMITQADCVAAFTSATFLPICRQYIQDSQAPLELFWLSGMPGEKPAEMPAVASLIEEGAQLMARRGGVHHFPVMPEQTASIVYTSGTTSMAKPVMLGNKAILHNAADAIRDVLAGDKVFSALPFYHSYGMTGAVLDTLVRGAEICINGDLKTMMRDLHLSQADSMITVPLVVETLHKQLWFLAEKEGKAKGLQMLFRICGVLKKLHLPYKNTELDEIRKKMMGSIHVIICGGAHLDKALCEEFLLMGVIILQGYGITECAPMVSTNGNRYNRIGSVGLVLDGYEVKTVDDEIYVKGKSLMNGYYKEKEETAAAITEDGWFKTGDLGYVDKDGYLYITGRQKNLIVFKNGKKLSPEKLEEAIMRVALVKEVMVYGAASGSSADDVVVAASIYPDPDLTGEMASYEILSKLQEEIDKINAALPLFQQVQMINIREKEFAKTASRKIKRHVTV